MLAPCSLFARRNSAGVILNFTAMCSNESSACTVYSLVPGGGSCNGLRPVLDADIAVEDEDEDDV